MSSHQLPDPIRQLVSDAAVPHEPRRPEDDPTLGITLPHVNAPQFNGTPKHRLVTLGDSLTHGFQSGAIYNTDISYPMIIAWEMGWDTYFRHPAPYVGPGGGLPINLEFLTRQLEQQYGNEVNWWELPLAGWSIRNFMNKVEDYWERGLITQPYSQEGNPVNHNLSVYGWKVKDLFTLKASILKEKIETPSNGWLFPLVENHQDRAALRVLGSARSEGRDLTAVEAAEVLGNEGSVEGDENDFGIETLVVFIGANNVLGSIGELDARWSCDNFRDLNKEPTIWCPDDFQQEFEILVEEVSKVRAKHIIWATVPHVTIAPLARGVGAKIQRGSRYYRYYTRPWINDSTFNSVDDPHLTGEEVRAIDTVIDEYNIFITNTVRQARQAGRDWYLLEIAGLLDRLASRRYIDDPLARPSWWTPYELPPELQLLQPVPNSRFFLSDAEGRKDGGLFSLDGVHPTTIGYGIVAQEIIKIMQLAGVKFYFGDTSTVDIVESNRLQGQGQPATVTQRQGPILVDFKRLIAHDTLISVPPQAFASGLSWLKVIDQTLSPFARLFQSGMRP